MKVSFPYMGSSTFYYKLLNMLGHNVIKPPPPTEKTFKLGVKHSPEFACFPMKVMLGNMIELHEKGVDTVLVNGGNGPCLAGYFGDCQQKILDDLGLDIDIVIFEHEFKELRDLMENVKLLKKHTSLFNLLRSVYICYKIAHSLDRLLKLIHRKRAYAVNPSNFCNLWTEIKEKYLEMQSLSEIKEVEKWGRDKINSLKYEVIPEEERVKIGVVGEIYVVLDEYTNNHIVEMINRLGMEVERSQYISSYFDGHLIPFKKRKYQHLLDKGEEYLECQVGGHAKRNIGHIINFKKRGFDGVIHLKSFNCHPEIIVQSMAEKISEDYDIPIMSISIDEQTSQSHIKTRLEAFQDIIKQKMNNTTN